MRTVNDGVIETKTQEESNFRSLLQKKHIFLLNSSDSPPTFEHNNRQGWPDLTMVSSYSLAAVCEWDVFGEESYSDHKFVKICINLIFLPFLLQDSKRLTKATIQPHQTLLEEEKFSQQEIDDILKNIPNDKALVILFHKTGKDEQNTKSYRPISLLPTLGKLLEKLLLQRFNYQLKTKKIQHPLQYGFREGKSADDALLHVTSLLEQARRQEKHAVLISLDISGAFDSLQYSSIRDRFASPSLFSNISETLLDTLRNRKVAMQTSEGPVLWEQTQG
ncbi:hypothetical protein AVEN_205329-1 [Araneus ventricosus]|uniref:Reverse transcriptase domain-containing protein n=1 Tax=Araneus ventricosus TaxID=182803 RepID=A0A4Y2WH47_ARAVE|nr:hypothetical protein AVEN_205329-1 [Araneus ventricosus]